MTAAKIAFPVLALAVSPMVPIAKMTSVTKEFLHVVEPHTPIVSELVSAWTPVPQSAAQLVGAGVSQVV